MGTPESWPIGTLLAAAGRLAEQAWNRRLARLGVTATGISALITLEGGPRSQAELAAANRVTEQSTGHTIDRLERQGLTDHDWQRADLILLIKLLDPRS